MRRTIILLLLAAGACAGRAPHPGPSTRFVYACDGHEIEHAGDRVLDGHDPALTVAWRDREGEHYVAWPSSATSTDAVEYVLPPDHRLDAIERVYDASRGRARVDWRLRHERRCTARGGYNDALRRFAGGQSFDQVARELALADRGEARELVHRAMLALQKRYYRDR